MNQTPEAKCLPEAESKAKCLLEVENNEDGCMDSAEKSDLKDQQITRPVNDHAYSILDGESDIDIIQEDAQIGNFETVNTRDEGLLNTKSCIFCTEFDTKFRIKSCTCMK